VKIWALLVEPVVAKPKVSGEEDVGFVVSGVGLVSATTLAEVFGVQNRQINLPAARTEMSDRHDKSAASTNRWSRIVLIDLYPYTPGIKRLINCILYIAQADIQRTVACRFILGLG
jgi:hypothetical protein